MCIAGDIAVTGVATRLPAKTPREVPGDRALPARLLAEVPEGRKGVAIRAHLLPDYDLDPRILRIPPLEQRRMHRMERVASAVIADAVTDAGIEAQSALAARTRVYIATTTLGPDPSTEPAARVRASEFAARAATAAGDHSGALASAAAALRAGAPPLVPEAAVVSPSITAGRVAKALGLTAGHAGVDADDASSLAAVHQAALALLAGRCDAAVVCAVTPLVTAEILYAYARAEVLKGALLAEAAVALVLTRVPRPDSAPARAALRAIAAARSHRDAATRALGGAGLAARDVAGVERSARGTAHDGGELEQLRGVYGSTVGAADAVLRYAPAAAGMLALARAVRRVENSGHECVAVSDGACASTAFHAIVAPRGADRSRRRPLDREVAIVGVGAVVPGAADAPALWRRIRDGFAAADSFPLDRWDGHGIGENTPVATVVRDGSGPAMLAAAARQAVRDAGSIETGFPAATGLVCGALSVRPGETRGRTRVAFARFLDSVAGALRARGVSTQDAEAILQRAWKELPDDGAGGELRAALSGHSPVALVARDLGIRGGAIVMDAACASSLVVLESAVDALRLGVVDTVVAAGFADNLVPEFFAGLKELGALSSSGTAPFHHDADGMVPGEGAVCIVLRRHADAMADGDRVYAVIRGVAAVTDGRAASVYAPEPAGQRRAVARAFLDAGADPADLSLLEAHGTGAPVGDSAEIATYGAFFGGRGPDRALPVGTSKAVIGHLGPASGMASVAKVAMALHHRTVPPFPVDVACTRLADAGLVPLATARPWPAPPRGPRHAGVASFGLGGASAFAVLAESPQRNDDGMADVAPPSVIRRFVPALRTVVPALRSATALAGARVLVDPDHVGLWRLVCERLEHAGARYTIAASSSERHAADIVVDLRGYHHDASGSSASRVAERVQRLAALLGPSYGHLAAVLSVSTGGDAVSAGVAGFMRALAQELPAARVGALEPSPDSSADDVAAAVIAELCRAEHPPVLRLDGRRRACVLEARAIEHRKVFRRIGPGDVVLCSGGGRGVGFACAAALARRGATVVVTGRQAAPDPSDPVVAMEDDAFATFRGEELTRLRAATRTVTPAQFEAHMARLAARRELGRNLAKGAEDGLALFYERCDVCDPDAVAGLALRVRAAHGDPTGLLHAAMVEHSARLSHKTPETVAATIAVKLAGLEHLLDALDEDELRFVVGFGSVAGALGSPGQCDYAAANAALASLVRERAGQGTGWHGVTMHWTAWQGIGAASRHPELQARVASGELIALTAGEGIACFVAELEHGDDDEVVFVDADAVHRAGLAPDSSPLVDRVLRRGSTSVTVERSLAVSEPFLDQHRLRATALLPAGFACEMLAQAAQQLHPAATVRSFEDVQLTSALEVPDSTTVVARVEVEQRGGVLAARLLTDRRIRDRSVARQHARAVLQHEPAPYGALGAIRVPAEPSPAARLRAPWHGERWPLSLGTIYSGLRDIDIYTDGAHASFWPPPVARLFPTTSSASLLADPLLIDAVLQAAATWDAFRHGHRLVPASIGRLGLLGMRAPGEPARIGVKVLSVNARLVTFSAVAVRSDGEPLLALDDGQLWRLEESPEP